MKKFVFAVLVLSSVSLLRAEDAPAGAHDASATNTPATVQAVVKAATEDKSGKLFQYISACLAERPSTNTDDLLRKLSQ